MPYTTHTAALGLIVQPGVVINADDTNKRYVNATGAPVTLSGPTEADLIADGLTLESTGGGLTDGDKGDITVGGSGASLTIDDGSVTESKLADSGVTAGTYTDAKVTFNAKGVATAAESGDKKVLAVLGVIDLTASEPAVRNTGDIYANSATAGDTSVTTQTLTTDYSVCKWDGSQWVETAPEDVSVVAVESTGVVHFFTAGTGWGTAAAGVPGLDSVLAIGQALTAPRTIEAGANPVVVRSDDDNLVAMNAGELEASNAVEGFKGRQTGRILIDGSVDMVTAEPALVAGQIFRAEATGNAQNTGQAVVAGHLYQANVAASGWKEFAPQEGWQIRLMSDGSEEDFVSGSWVVRESGSGRIVDWATGLNLAEGQLVRHEHRLLMSKSERTTTGTFDATEASNFVCVSQTEVKEWAPTTIIVEGEAVIHGLRVYRCSVTFQSAATFSTGNLQVEIDTDSMSVWTADTRFEVGGLIRRKNMVLLRRFDVVGGAASESTFDDTEAARWEMFMQEEPYGSFDSSRVYVAKEKIEEGGSVYERNSSGTPANATFVEDIAEWTLVKKAPASRLLDHVMKAPSAADTGEGSCLRSAAPVAEHGGYTYTLSDADAAVPSQHQLDLSASGLSFETGSAYQFRMTVERSTVADHVVELRFDDGAGNETSELYNIGSSGASLIPGGASSGNVTSIGAIKEVSVGDAKKCVLDFVLAWTGNSGGSPTLGVRPVVNTNGASLPDNTATGSVVVTDFAMGDPSEFPSEGSATTTLLNASAGDIDHVLPAMTGSGSVYFLTLVDKTNKVEISPAAGEQFIGYAVDAKYDAGNDSTGTMYRVDDIAAGVASLRQVNQGTSGAYQTQVETLTYAASAVEGVSFTHDSTQSSNTTNPPASEIYVGDIKIVRRYIGEGKAAVQIHLDFIQGSGSSQDPPVAITLPTGTLTEPFQPRQQAFRDELNVSAYVLLDNSVDTISINRDDDINDDSPAYAVVEGIGNWVGERPDSVVMAGMVPIQSVHHAVFSLSQDSSSSIVCPFDRGTGDTAAITNSAGTITVPAGKYRIIAHATRHGAVLDYELWNVTTNSQIQQYNIDATTIDGSGVTLPVYVTFATTTDIQVRETGANVAVVWNGSDGVGGSLGYGPYGCYLDIQQLAESTVVNPDSLVPEDLHRVRLSLSSDQGPLTVLTPTTINFDLEDYDTHGIASGNSVTIVNTGWYDLTAMWMNATVNANDTSCSILVDGSPVASGGDNLNSGGGTGRRMYAHRTMLLNAGQVITVQAYAGDQPTTISGSATETGSRAFLEVIQLPGKDVVAYNPSELEAKTLHYAKRSREVISSTAFLAAGLVEVPFENASYSFGITSSGNGFTVNQDGRYRLESALHFQVNSVNFDGNLHVLVNGVSVESASQDLAGGSSANDQILFSTELDLNAGQVVTLSWVPDSDDTVTVTKGSFFTIRQLPTTEVVSPGDVPVEDVEVLLDQQTISNGGTLTIPADLSAYEYIRFEVEDAGGGDVSVEGRCKATAISDCRIALHHDDASGYIFFDTDTPGTTATLTATVGFTGVMTARAIGVKAQKSVINTTDVTVNDQTTSGYFDVGDMRMQWGKVSLGTGTHVVTFPAPFADANAVVTANYQHATEAPGNQFSVSIFGTTSTQFSGRHIFENGATVGDAGEDWSWIAIGRKP